MGTSMTTQPPSASGILVCDAPITLNRFQCGFLKIVLSFRSYFFPRYYYTFFFLSEKWDKDGCIKKKNEFVCLLN